METQISDLQRNEAQRAHKNDPLISVIVPIFNVEKYVKKCLDSLRVQTMKHIEVIMVDDGSTDSSGAIAEKYVSAPGAWPGFRCIHTENRGLSAARNKGLDIAKAEWIMFVDSDDWVKPEFCRIPYEASREYNVDMVIFQADNWKNGRIRHKKVDKNIPLGIIDEFTAHEYGGTAAWNKLYKKKLWEEIRYPEGRVYEDRITTHKLVHKAEQIMLLHNTLYYYRIRKGSITHTRTQSNKKEYLLSEIERHENLLSYGFPEEKLNSSLCSAAIGYLVSTKDDDSITYNKTKDIFDKMDMASIDLNRKQKIAYKVWRMNKNLFYLLCRTTGRLKAL